MYSDLSLTTVNFFKDKTSLGQIIVIQPGCGTQTGGCTCGSSGCSCFYGNNGQTV
jgi:hypothetical protein